jgi:hypothetical protein
MGWRAGKSIDKIRSSTNWYLEAVWWAHGSSLIYFLYFYMFLNYTRIKYPDINLAWGFRKKLNQRTGDVAQTVERLPNKCKALNLNPNTAKKKKTTRPERKCWWINNTDMSKDFIKHCTEGKNKKQKS